LLTLRVKCDSLIGVMSDWKIIHEPKNAIGYLPCLYPIGYGGGPVDPNDEIPMEWPKEKTLKYDLFVLTFDEKCDKIYAL